MTRDPDCIFCQIVSGSAPASVVYRDKTVLAFMDRRPYNVGHFLVIPLEHVANLSELATDIGEKVFRVARQVAETLRHSDVRCERINLFLADGAVTGQEVFHSHLHVIPRFEDDGFETLDALVKYVEVSRDQLDATAAKIRSEIESGS